MRNLEEQLKKPGSNYHYWKTVRSHADDLFEHATDLLEAQHEEEGADIDLEEAVEKFKEEHLKTTLESEEYVVVSSLQLAVMAHTEADIYEMFDAQELNTLPGLSEITSHLAYSALEYDILQYLDPRLNAVVRALKARSEKDD